MAASKDFIEFVAEQLGVLGPITIRSMFGGAGIFRNGRMFALIADDVLYLKVDDATRENFEAEGLEAFAYVTQGGRKTIMSYMRCPERLFEDADDMEHWASAAFAAAERANTKKPGRTAARSRKPNTMTGKHNPRPDE